MTSVLGGSVLFRKIMASILLASVLFLSLLTIVVYYSNQILEDELLATQTDFELENIKSQLAVNPEMSLPRTASSGPTKAASMPPSSRKEVALAACSAGTDSRAAKRY